MLRGKEREKNIGGETFDRFRKIVYICNDISFFKRKERFRKLVLISRKKNKTAPSYAVIPIGN